MELIIIAAVARNNVIGKEGKVPWYIPEDINHFKRLTTGHAVIMGRVTYESIPARFSPLPGRVNIVVSRNRQYEVPAGVQLAHSLEEAIQYVQQPSSIVAGIDYSKAFVIGGQQMYEQAFPYAQRLEITQVQRSPDGDAFFPAISSHSWIEQKRIEDEQYAFLTYARRSS